MQNVSLNIILLAVCIPWDMALLPIWITSGSCFALIHPGTNDVPPSPSRSCPSAIPSTISSRPRVSIPGSFRLVFAQVREPMESFLISDESALPRTKVRAPFSSTDFISARFFRVARFSPSQDLRWYTVGCFWRKRRYLRLASDSSSVVLLKIYVIAVAVQAHEEKVF